MQSTPTQITLTQITPAHTAPAHCNYPLCSRPHKCGPEQIIHYWVHEYRRVYTGGLPTLKWLAEKSGYSIGTVSKHRGSFFFQLLKK